MKVKQGFYKSFISLCMILCVILSLGCNLKQIKYPQVQTKDFKSEIFDLLRWEESIVPATQKTELIITHQEPSQYETEAFWILLQNIKQRLSCVFCAEVVLMGFLISIFYRIIDYIHNKDGPKKMMTPTY